MEAKLPVYKCIINASEKSPLEVQAVALVDQPAIERNFLAFKSQKPLHFSIDESRRIISGPAMLADTPIYRKDNEFGEYLVVFDKPTIQSIAEKFFSNGLVQAFNIMHDSSLPATGTCIFESFITDESRGIKPMVGFEDVPQGSWFISAKVSDDNIWNLVKDGKVKGFSVEGLFQLVPLKMATTETTPESVLDQIMKLLENF